MRKLSLGDIWSFLGHFKLIRSSIFRFTVFPANDVVTFTFDSRWGRPKKLEGLNTDFSDSGRLKTKYCLMTCSHILFFKFSTPSFYKYSLLEQVPIFFVLFFVIFLFGKWEPRGPPNDGNEWTRRASCSSLLSAISGPTCSRYVGLNLQNVPSSNLGSCLSYLHRINDTALLQSVR